MSARLAPSATDPPPSPKAWPLSPRHVIADFTALPTPARLETAKEHHLKGRDEIIAGRVMHEIRERLEILKRRGLDYLSLDRSAATLSGGEGQRIRLATQIGSKLRGGSLCFERTLHRPSPPRQRRLLAGPRVAQKARQHGFGRRNDETPSAAQTT